jgi:hypothetical protein
MFACSGISLVWQPRVSIEKTFRSIGIRREGPPRDEGKSVASAPTKRRFDGSEHRDRSPLSGILRNPSHCDTELFLTRDPPKKRRPTVRLKPRSILTQAIITADCADSSLRSSFFVLAKGDFYGIGMTSPLLFPSGFQMHISVFA